VNLKGFLFRFVLFFLALFSLPLFLATLLISTSLLPALLPLAARITGYFATIFGPKREGGLGFNLVEIHSRKSQAARNSAAEKFKTSKGIIMFSSDVSARGMDFADVTMVIQVGLTDKEQYVHRLGRTARAGKSGCGLLILADYEQSFLNELRDFPIVPAAADSKLTGGTANGITGHRAAGGPDYTTVKEVSALPKPAVGIAPVVAAPADLAAVIDNIPKRADLTREACQAYSATLGFYKGNARRCAWKGSMEAMVRDINELFLTSLGCAEVPLMPRDTLGKMGLRGVAGIREGPKGWKPGRE
jgi:ATP-dependent RNA helicase MSS116, mitochondrial